MQNDSYKAKTRKCTTYSNKSSHNGNEYVRINADLLNTRTVNIKATFT